MFQDEVINREKRFSIYNEIFKGRTVSHGDMFRNPGYKGLEYLPYPRHVKEMMQ